MVVYIVVPQVVAEEEEAAVAAEEENWFRSFAQKSSWAYFVWNAISENTDQPFKKYSSLLKTATW